MIKTLIIPALLLSLSACTIPAVMGPESKPQIIVPKHQTPIAESGASHRSLTAMPDDPTFHKPIVHKVWVTPRANEYGDILNGYVWHLVEKDWQVCTIDSCPPTHFNDHVFPQPLTRHIKAADAGEGMDLVDLSSNSDTITQARETAAAAARKTQELALKAFKSAPNQNPRALPAHMIQRLKELQGGK